MATPNFDTGFYATFAVGTNNLPTRDWSIRASTDSDEARNSESGVIPIPLTTYQRYMATINFDVDLANPTFSGGPNIALGTVLASLNFYQRQPTRGALGSITTPSANTNPGWTATLGKVMNFSNGAQVRGTSIMSYSMSVALYGVVTTPF